MWLIFFSREHKEKNACLAKLGGKVEEEDGDMKCVSSYFDCCSSYRALIVH